MPKSIRYVVRFLVKGLLVLILGVNATIYNPASAEAPAIEQEGWKLPNIQTLESHPLADNISFSNAQIYKFEIYVETIKNNLTYSDYLILKRIAFCESSFRHYTDNGIIKNNKSNDSGLFQINVVHEAKAKSMGLDLEDLKDNIEYAIYLYKKNGTRDWSASKLCHKS
ncbi:MAG: hypothetical protein IPM48_14600 [Saprospiraceae bacterium]|nr:hypothetical protein [Saprospiraceae bacterium]